MPEDETNTDGIKMEPSDEGLVLPWEYVEASIYRSANIAIGLAWYNNINSLKAREHCAFTLSVILLGTGILKTERTEELIRVATSDASLHYYTVQGNPRKEAKGLSALDMRFVKTK